MLHQSLTTRTPQYKEITLGTALSQDSLRAIHIIIAIRRVVVG